MSFASRLCLEQNLASERGNDEVYCEEMMACTCNEIVADCCKFIHLCPEMNPVAKFTNCTIFRYARAKITNFTDITFFSWGDAKIAEFTILTIFRYRSLRISQFFSPFAMLIKTNRQRGGVAHYLSERDTSLVL